MNRRAFLQLLGLGTAGAIVAPTLARKYFFPPEGGWRVDFLNPDYVSPTPFSVHFSKSCPPGYVYFLNSQKIWLANPRLRGVVTNIEAPKGPKYRIPPIVGWPALNDAAAPWKWV